jgi:hypothetical protein
MKELSEEYVNAIPRNDFATMAILVPSRGRPENIKELQQSCIETMTQSPILTICDDDDPALPEYRQICDHLWVFPRESKGMAVPLNHGVRKLLREHWFTHFAFLGDDHRPRTHRWDQAFIDVLEERGGLVYGNDLFQGENLPTAVGMEGSIAAELNGMVPDGFIHLYLDNFWKRLGEDIGRLTYLPECIIEHCHPLVGKSEVDEGYVRVNSKDIYDADAQRFGEYLASDDYARLVSRFR